MKQQRRWWLTENRRKLGSHAEHLLYWPQGIKLTIATGRSNRVHARPCPFLSSCFLFFILIHTAFHPGYLIFVLLAFAVQTLS